MKPLRAALSQWKPGESFAADPLLILKSEWSAIVGADVAGSSMPAELSRDALLIVTRSSAWSQQLSFLSEHVIASVRQRTGIAIQRLRFRVGRLSEQPAPRKIQRRSAAPPRAARTDAPQTLEAAVERFRASVASTERAKARAGWKECIRCGVRIHPSSGPCCAPCENARLAERDARVARLLFEAPWLGYAGIAPLVDHLSLQEYRAIRLTLLRRWKDALERVRRTGGAKLTTRDRMIASSYVLLKSELDPERIAPAVVRDLLGDELHNILYGNVND